MTVTSKVCTNLLLRYTTFNHCNIKCVVVILPMTDFGTLNSEVKRAGESNCTTAINLEIMAQPTGQMDRGVKVIEVHYPVP